MLMIIVLMIIIVIIQMMIGWGATITGHVKTWLE